MDWSSLPLTQLIMAAVSDSSRNILARGDIVRVQREDIEMAWIETRFMDPLEHREALSRLSIARGSNLQALITFDFWMEDKAHFAPVWDEVMRSVELGRYVDAPSVGDVLD